ncbi:hypothetical protein TNCV_4182221 [Trichonephila clavipes]|nr:hypothetical protein TNCV_4182221 [Trichonephila clavipes]
MSGCLIYDGKQLGDGGRQILNGGSKTAHYVQKGIYQNTESTCLIRLGRNQVPVQWVKSRWMFSHHCLGLLQHIRNDVLHAAIAQIQL